MHFHMAKSFFFKIGFKFVVEGKKIVLYVQNLKEILPIPPLGLISFFVIFFWIFSIQEFAFVRCDDQIKFL